MFDAVNLQNRAKGVVRSGSLVRRYPQRGQCPDSSAPSGLESLGALLSGLADAAGRDLFFRPAWAGLRDSRKARAIIDITCSAWLSDR